MAEARVTVTINGQNYPLACQPGEEDHIRALAARLDEYSRQIAASGGSINESRLLVMVGLIMADRLHELEKGTWPLSMWRSLLHLLLLLPSPMRRAISLPLASKT